MFSALQRTFCSDEKETMDYIGILGIVQKAVTVVSRHTNVGVFIFVSVSKCCSTYSKLVTM